MKCILFVILLIGAYGSVCTKNDHAIFKSQGDTFEHRFRKLGGLTVSKWAFQRAVSKLVGFSTSCASCYADAYICSYDHCKWACYTEAPSCHECVVNHGCVETCNKCTNFQ